MSRNQIELPLFPLTVLFPGAVLPLHIFEPRYRQMIVDCQRENKPMGIVLPKPESEYLREVPYSIGTMAEIHNLERLEDGRYILNAVGIRRFRIVREHREKPYLSALVEPYEDVSEVVAELSMATKLARVLFEEYLELLLQASNEEDMGVDLPDEPEELSYFIASLLQIQDERKQHLLELSSTYQRLREEVVVLRREVPFLRQMVSNKMSDDRTMLN